MKVPSLINNILNPQLIYKIDRYMLLYHPRLWVTKVYYLFYWALLSNIFLTVITLALPIKPYHVDDFWHIEITLFCIETLVLIIWLIWQSFYNIEKQYGSTSIIKSWVEIGTYIVCIFLILSTSIFFPLTFKQAMLREISEIDLAADAILISLFEPSYRYPEATMLKIYNDIITDNSSKLDHSDLERESLSSIYKQYLKTKSFQTAKNNIDEGKKDISSFVFPDHERSNKEHKYLEEAFDSETLALLANIDSSILMYFEEIIDRKKESINNIRENTISIVYDSIIKKDYEKIEDRINKYSISKYKTDISNDSIISFDRIKISDSKFFILIEIIDLYYWNDS